MFAEQFVRLPYSSRAVRVDVHQFLGRTKISRHFLAAPTAACDERGLQQGFVKDEMGFRGQLHGNNFEPPMLQLNQMRTKSDVRITFRYRCCFVVNQIHVPARWT